jgi:hypothetical protein
MDPKLLLFSAAFLLGVPLLILAGLVVRPFRKVLMFLMCFSLCYPETFTINFMSREAYRMATRGFELGLFDLCAVALFFILVIQPHGHRFRWFPPLTIIYGIYILFGLISWLMAPGSIPVPGDVYTANTAGGYEFYNNFETGLYPLFELSKIIRGGFAYLVTVNFLKDEEHFRSLLGSLLVVAFIITIEALIDRYIQGYNRVSATLGHPNSLGTFMGMMGTLMFGVALFRTTFLSSGTFAIATAASMVSVLLTISRGALSAFVLGIWLDVSSLFHRYLNIKNFTILFFGSLVALGFFFIAADTITTRFLVQQDAVSDIEYRGLYNEEAKMMAHDHSFGVGLGNFSTYSWLKYGPAVGLNEYGTPAHNLWYLTLGELGYPGLFAFIFYWLRFYSIGLPFLFRRRTDLIYAIAASACAASMIGHIQNMLQLSYRQTSIYMFNKILIAMVIAAWYIDRDTRRTERKERRLARSQKKTINA